MKSLSELNKEYWKKVSADKTTSLKIMPSDEDLDLVPTAIHVLDVGCGDGQLSEWLSEKGFLVSAIDINENAIIACNKRNTKVNYTLQDITKRTTFENSLFDLVCFRFTLANIHRDEWPVLRKEVDRLVAPGGFVWLAEPLVSTDYQKRYELSKRLLNDEHTIFIFKNPRTARDITTTDQLQTAIERGEVYSISRHYTKKELMNLFPAFKILREKMIVVKSPSGFNIQTFTALLKKPVKDN